MDGAKSSPFAPASDIPLQKNPPLAPSQELAYRNKCIQLKKRLAEIETNNDQTRRRISAEKDRIHKQRLLRAILLNQLKEIMETPGRKFKPEELEKMGIAVNGGLDDEDHPRTRPDGEMLLDDSSDDSDDIPEPSDRPTRNKRSTNNYRGETMMSATTNQQPMNPSSIYQQQQPGLQSIAPASSNPYSPTAARGGALHTSSFQTPAAATVSPSRYPVLQSQQSQSSYTQLDAHRYPSQSSPIQPHQPQILHGPSTTAASPAHSITHSITHSHSHSHSHSQPAQPHPDPPTLYRPTSSTSISASQPHPHPSPPTANQTPPSQPPRPSPPYNQFYAHMRPQLEADAYPRSQIESRINEEWRNLSEENRALWEERYNEQMREYEEGMDFWKRSRR